MVYAREGEPCKTCGSAIKRIVIGQRSAHYCPKCQP
jgi:formamidopyrimidine-DNA glycosylase